MHRLPEDVGDVVTKDDVVTQVGDQQVAPVLREGRHVRVGALLPLSVDTGEPLVLVGGHTAPHAAVVPHAEERDGAARVVSHGQVPLVGRELHVARAGPARVLGVDGVHLAVGSIEGVGGHEAAVIARLVHHVHQRACPVRAHVRRVGSRRGHACVLAEAAEAVPGLGGLAAEHRDAVGLRGAPGAHMSQLLRVGPYEDVPLGGGLAARVLLTEAAAGPLPHGASSPGRAGHPRLA
mmetsp:Transcript_83749/g.237539  ORF Transcript_83749/g.237539 Transcript_83749/m.237539 type:complete len:236 (+) Transcript_83749:684-1391(+)